MAKLINEARALESFRNSDFDVYSAYGEVVDNSVQAEATWVKIKMETNIKEQPGRPYYKINEIVFSDNGKGMSKEVLDNCLAMGYSSRYNDRSGIGRFGVGMTLASINQCKRVEVYSRENGKDWLWIYADLDEIANEKMVDIPEAIVKSLPDEYNDIASDGAGTVVVWTKYDRQPESADRIEKELRVWLGRTYRYFIWDGVQIFVNKEEVFAIDPLYVKTENTQFRQSPKATEYAPIEFVWPTMKDLDDNLDLPYSATIKIRMSILPVEFRENKGAGGSDNAKKRYIDRNEGISIVRNKREVFYGEIPYFKPAFEERDRWWGGEISFDAVLDRAFTVKNIKRGALPTIELREEIEKRINPTRKSVRNEVSDYWQNKEKEGRDGSLPPSGTDNGHGRAQRIINATPTPPNKIDVGKNTEVEISNLPYQITEDTKWQIIRNKITIEDGHWQGLDFFTTNHLGGKDLLVYNKRHLFFEELDSIMKKIQENYPDSELHKNLKALIDLMLAAYSNAEAAFSYGQTMTIESFIEFIKSNWGMYLKQYLETSQDKNKLLSEGNQ
jgi:hypothetical protein